MYIIQIYFQDQAGPYKFQCTVEQLKEAARRRCSSQYCHHLSSCTNLRSCTNHRSCTRLSRFSQCCLNQCHCRGRQGSSEQCGLSEVTRSAPKRNRKWLLPIRTYLSLRIVKSYFDHVILQFDHLIDSYFKLKASELFFFYQINNMKYYDNLEKKT